MANCLWNSKLGFPWGISLPGKAKQLSAPSLRGSLTWHQWLHGAKLSMRENPNFCGIPLQINAPEHFLDNKNTFKQGELS